MGSFISRQPNGLLCRFSTVVDTVTHWNMTDEEYIEMRSEMAMNDARKVLQKHIQPFDMVKERFAPNNNTQEEFEELIEEMSNPVFE